MYYITPIPKIIHKPTEYGLRIVESQTIRKSFDICGVFVYVPLRKKKYTSIFTLNSHFYASLSHVHFTFLIRGGAPWLSFANITEHDLVIFMETMRYSINPTHLDDLAQADMAHIGFIFGCLDLA